MKLSDFNYELPAELIAQAPLVPRDTSRLLVVDRATSGIQDKHFFNILDLIPAGDVLVLNNTKVFSARILGKKKKTGGKVDLLLLEAYRAPSLNPDSEYVSAAEAEEIRNKKIWRCLAQPALHENQEIIFEGDTLEAVFLKRDTDGIPLIEFKNTDDVMATARKIGTMPLPPYIKREASGQDDATYQTVYAQKEGAVAAPTAGLHFTEELLKKLRDKGVQVCFVTLHVGYGTFKPVEDLENHKMHSEVFELSKETADCLNQAKSKGRKVWAVGTTTLRVLETCVQEKKLVAGQGETDLYIRDPFEFEAVDRLITNFHLPKTTLLLLVSAFMGESLRKKAYEHAVHEKYRFYSYGDAMVIL